MDEDDEEDTIGCVTVFAGVVVMVIWIAAELTALILSKF